ncbi:MAG: UPF0175 family protein [Lachnospiraceae bacterium]|nr:UPF0175 family protein [Lachnospiraceae bacterium]
MCQIAFTIPNEVLYDTKMRDTETVDFARKAVALQYYIKEGVSLGYCAQIANMSKGDFIRFLGENKVSVFQFDSEEEFLEDAKMRKLVVNTTPLITLTEFP